MPKVVNSHVFDCKYRGQALLAKPLVIVYDDGSTDVLCPVLDESKTKCVADKTHCVYKKRQ